MANIREIQSRINSVRDTMKITNAMYMISSSKMTQARKKLADTEPYFYGLQGEIARILRHMPDLQHQYFDKRTGKTGQERTVGIVVITADKGLAGSYNHNVLKLAQELIETDCRHKIFVVGELGRHYFMRQHIPIEMNFQYTVQKPSLHRARCITGTLMEMFEAQQLDEVYVVYTRMENSVKLVPEIVKLLPLEHISFNRPKLPLNIHREAVVLYPSAEAVLDSIVPNYVFGMIYGCLVESYASEHNARMTAMKTATDSAQDLIRELSIVYNRARQAAITQEITEVCSGARAQR